MYGDVTNADDPAHQKLHQHDYPLSNRKAALAKAKTSLGNF